MSVSYPERLEHPEAARQLETLLTDLLGPRAQRLARETGFVQRHSPIDGSAFARTLVCGFLDTPEATYTDLQQVMAAGQVDVTPQAIEQRMTEAASQFLLRVLESLLTDVLIGKDCELGILSGFEGVYLQDGSRIMLPDGMGAYWKGNGSGSGKGAQAGVRIQARLELQRGSLQGPWLQDACADERSGPSSLEEHPLPEGSLYVTDTGYVTLERIRFQNETGRFFLAPASCRAKVVDQKGQVWDLPDLLEKRIKAGQKEIDELVFLGKEERVPCRLLAVKNPQCKPSPARKDLKSRRKGSRRDVQVGRKKEPKGQHKRKVHRESAARRKMSGWIVMITNVPGERLTPQQARELIRARWQAELLWKLWKQQGQVDTWRSEKPMRILCELYAKLIGVTIQHWFTLVGCWQDPHRSLVKAHLVVQRLAVSVVLTLSGAVTLAEVIGRSQDMMRHCRLNPRRSRPNTSQRLVQASREERGRPPPEPVSTCLQTPLSLVQLALPFFG